MKNLITTYCVPKFLSKPFQLVAFLLSMLTVLSGCTFQKIAQNRFSRSYHLAQKIGELQIDSNNKNENWNSKNYLMFMLMNPRMNFVDIAILQKKQILEAKYQDGKLVSGTLI
ncbi:MAG: hypothetical protein IH948_10150, partial [Bacteroidetes bacterium]|nr:hypothetical protein [Bacteroidota bacterium]